MALLANKSYGTLRKAVILGRQRQNFLAAFDGAWRKSLKVSHGLNIGRQRKCKDWHYFHTWDAINALTAMRTLSRTIVSVGQQSSPPLKLPYGYTATPCLPTIICDMSLFNVAYSITKLDGDRGEKKHDMKSEN
jgi:hypothetical protein